MRGGLLLLSVLLFGAAYAAAGEYTPIGPIEPERQAATAKPDVKKPPATQAAPKSTAAVPLPPAAPKPEQAKIEPAKAEAAVSTPAPKLPPPRPNIAKTDTKTDTKAEAKPGTAKTAAINADASKPDAAKPNTPKAETGTPGTTMFADIPFGERIKIQAALFWSGDYAGATNSEDPMLAAVKNYQKRIKTKVTGELTPAERASLVAAAGNHEQEFGWSVVVDPATGIRIGLPTKMVPQARDAARGTLWSSAHGEVQVETFRIKDPNLKLAALFEQEKKEPSSRRVEYSVLNDDNFFISGMQGLKMFSVRAKLRDGEVRGFTIRYDQMMETIVSPVMVAMASAFSPFPERSAPFAALAKSVEYGNELIVSSRGHIITDRKLVESCQVIVADGLGDADRVADDKDKNLALLRVYGQRKLSPLALSRDLPKTADISLIGIPDPKEQNSAKGSARKLTEIKARLVDGIAIELRQPVPMAGFSGAAAVDGQGRFVGLTEMRNAVLASTEAAAPPVRLVSADTIRTFLTAHNIEAAPSPGADAKAAVVRIICVRK